MLVMLALAGSAPALDTSGLAHTGSSLRALALSGNPAALRALAAPTDSCVGQDDPNAPVVVQEAAMECMVNFARAQAGVRQLVDSRKLDGSSDRKAVDILRCDRFSHEACGRDFLYWFRRSGFLNGRCWWAGENLAWGTSGFGSVRAVVNAWLHSPTHRANILGPEYDKFGISLRVGNLSGSSNVHLWVNHFGRHC